MARVTVHADAAALGAVVAQAVVRASRTALSARGRFRLALPGGRSPEPVYEALVSRGGAVAWSGVHVFFADERAVPPGDPLSNHRQVSERLLDRIDLPPANVHRMRGEAADLDAAARDYEALLEEPLDLVILGLGEDGHVASLFPGSPLLAVAHGLVGVVTDSPKPPPRRLTLLPPALAAAREVVVIALGAAKADAARRALTRGADPSLPAALVATRDWHLDTAAASALEPRR